MFVVFIISGLMIALLLLGKRYEEKNKKPFFLMGWISLGDEWVRKYYHQFVKWYPTFKVEALFFFKKQLPMHTKLAFSKFQTTVNEKIDKYSKDIRASKLLKRRSEGISEFLKNISEVEKGNGEIRETYEENTEEHVL